MNNTSAGTQPGLKRSFSLFPAIMISVITMLALLFTGVTGITPSDIFTEPLSSPHSQIFWNIRLPRLVCAFFAGAGLSLGGLVFQAMFQNSLASPYTLGVASGASLGATVYLFSGLSFTLLFIPGVTVCAFIGALGSLAIVYQVSLLSSGRGKEGFLLSGVVISFFFSSLIMLVQYLSDFTQSFHILRWLMGGLDVAGFSPVIRIVPIVSIGSMAIFFYARELDLIACGYDLAESRGLSTSRLRKILFVATTIIVAAIVAECGPIGFVGLMVPHFCRLLFPALHSQLVPACFFCGGIFLSLCDTMARTLIAPAEMPVGVITALLGGPFFFWLIFRQRVI